jgi:hypothetical protein
MVKLQMAIPSQCVNSRWFKDSLQPAVHLKNKSPFQSKQELASMVNGGEPEEQIADEIALQAEAGDFEQCG